jgi:cell division protein ZapA
MAQVTVKINGYSYTVGCEDGQEAHLQAMASQV